MRMDLTSRILLKVSQASPGLWRTLIPHNEVTSLANYEYVKNVWLFFFFKHAWFFQMWDLFLKRLSDLYSGNEKQDLVLIKCWLLLSDTLPPFLAPLLRMLLFQLWNSSFPHQLWGLSHHLEESSLSTLSKYYPSPTHGPVTHTHRFAMN